MTGLTKQNCSVACKQPINQSIKTLNLSLNLHWLDQQ